MARRRPRGSGTKTREAASRAASSTVTLRPPIERPIPVPVDKPSPPPRLLAGLPASTSLLFLSGLLIGLGLATLAIATLQEMLWHSPQPGMVARQLGAAALLSLIARIVFFPVRAQPAGAATQQPALWLLAIGVSAALLFVTVRQMESWRGLMADQFLLPPVVFAYAVAAPVIVLWAIVICLTAVCFRSLEYDRTSSPRSGGRALIAMGLMLGAALGAVILLASESTRAAVYLSLSALFGAGLLSAIGGPRSPTQVDRAPPAPHTSGSALVPSTLALVAAISLAFILYTVLAGIALPSDTHLPIALMLGAGIAGTCVAFGPRGAARNAIAGVLTLISAAAALIQMDFSGLQQSLIQMAGIAAATGALTCIAALGTPPSGAWPLGNSVLIGAAAGLWMSPQPVKLEVQTAAPLVTLEPWQSACPDGALLTIDPKTQLYGPSSSWFKDAGGPRADLLLIRAADAARLSAAQANRLLSRAISTMKTGGRLVVELPSPVLSEAALRTARRGPRAERSTAYLLRAPQGENEQLALLMGHDVPAWLTYTLGRDAQLALYPVGNRAQLAALLAASSGLQR